MSLHRRNPRRDQNEKELVAVARSVGAEVWQISGKGLPDLLVRFRGTLYAGEVKTAKGRLRASQGHFEVWRTPQDVLLAIGAVQ